MGGLSQSSREARGHDALTIPPLSFIHSFIRPIDQSIDRPAPCPSNPTTPPSVHIHTYGRTLEAMRFSSSFFFLLSSECGSSPPPPPKPPAALDAAESAPLLAALAPPAPRGGGESVPEMEPGESSEPKSLLLPVVAAASASRPVLVAMCLLPVLGYLVLLLLPASRSKPACLPACLALCSDHTSRLCLSIKDGGSGVRGPELMMHVDPESSMIGSRSHCGVPWLGARARGPTMMHEVSSSKPAASKQCITTDHTNRQSNDDDPKRQRPPRHKCHTNHACSHWRICMAQSPARRGACDRPNESGGWQKADRAIVASNASTTLFSGGGAQAPEKKGRSRRAAWVDPPYSEPTTSASRKPTTACLLACCKLLCDRSINHIILYQCD